MLPRSRMLEVGVARDAAQRGVDRARLQLTNAQDDLSRLLDVPGSVAPTTPLFDRATWLATGVAATAAIAAFALPLKLNILVAIAAAIAVGLLIEAVDRRRHRPEVLLVPADSMIPADELEQVEAGDAVALREELHP